MNTWRLMTHHIDAKGALEWARKNERIAIGWGDIGDLRTQGFTSADDIMASIRAHHDYPKYRNAKSGGTSLWDLYVTMQKGDLVILSTGKRELVVEVVGDYEWHENPDLEGDYYHQRRVELTTLGPEKVWQEAGASFPVGQSKYRTLLRCVAR